MSWPISLHTKKERKNLLSTEKCCFPLNRSLTFWICIFSLLLRVQKGRGLCGSLCAELLEVLLYTPPKDSSLTLRVLLTQQGRAFSPGAIAINHCKWDPHHSWGHRVDSSPSPSCADSLFKPPSFQQFRAHGKKERHNFKELFSFFFTALED